MRRRANAEGEMDIIIEMWKEKMNSLELFVNLFFVLVNGKLYVNTLFLRTSCMCSMNPNINRKFERFQRFITEVTRKFNVERIKIYVYQPSEKMHAVEISKEGSYRCNEYPLIDGVEFAFLGNAPNGDLSEELLRWRKSIEL